MRTSTLTLATIMTLAAAGTALGNGLVRDLNVSTANHSAFGLGWGSFSLQNTNVNNFSSTADPYGTSNNSGTTQLFTDANGTVSGTNYGSVFGGSNTTQNQLSSHKWFISSATAPGGALQNRGGVWSTFGTLSQSYTGNSASVNYTNAGPGSTRYNVAITYALADGAGNGQTNLVSTLTVTRTDTNAGNVAFSLGTMWDLDVGTSATNTVTNVSGAGERRLNFQNGSNFGEALALESAGSTLSYMAGARATVAPSAAGSNLTSAGALPGSIAGAGDLAAGFAWTGISLAPGASFSVTSVVSINQVAVIPAPGSAALLGIGGLLMARRRRA